MYKILLFALISTSSLCAYFNERHYEGINPLWENAEVEGRLEIISQFLPSNPVVYEVGGKDGKDSVKLAEMWPKGKIITFEANSNQFLHYQEKSKDYTNMFGYNLAVNTYDGFAKFYLCWGTGGTDPFFEGASSLLEAAEAYKIHYQGPEIIVPCVIFDHWCQSNEIKNVDFMWLDLEGFEMQLLTSSPEILKTVKVIYTETNFFLFRIGCTQYDDLYKYLDAQGFESIAHWYQEGLQGDAIFVRKELVSKI